MSVLVTDNGFGTPADKPELVLLPETDPEDIRDQLDEADLVGIDFPSFADGRGLTLARRLRRMGYLGRLRATGHVLADQYAMTRRAGFDEVEISEDLARRQPEAQWLFRANWKDHDYQHRLRG